MASVTRARVVVKAAGEGEQHRKEHNRRDVFAFRRIDCRQRQVFP